MSSQTAADAPVGYPHELTEQALLDDGTSVMFRAILPADRDRLERLFHRLSPEALYRRFFTPVPRPRPAMLDYLVTVDYRNRLAIVAVIDDEVVGVARFDRLAAPVHPGDAEAAVIVEDARQGRGLGTRLLWRLSAAARARGVSAFVAGILAENRPMLGLLRVLGQDVQSGFDRGEYEIRVVLDRVPGIA